MNITRRDFINGFALSVSAGGTLSPLELLAMSDQATPYPPALTGLRGSHAGSFEVSHALVADGNTWPRPAGLTDPEYDLVVVGGGISGLSAALMFRQQAGPDARILVLDNHDDFGGHAKRNEFSIDGRTVIGYGGSQTIQNPGSYSPQAKKLLRDIHIEPAKFYEYFDQDFYRSRDLGRGIYFSAEQYGKDSIHPLAVTPWEGGYSQDAEALINSYPLSSEARQSFLRLLTGSGEVLAGMTDEEKARLMQRISFSDFLREHLGVHEEVVTLLRDLPKGLWGCGYDALSALEGYRLGMPGTRDIFDSDSLIESEDDDHDDEPYIFHFPDGNAGVARSLVRQLIPDAVPGKTMEDLVVSRVDYGKLDRPSSLTRIRLNSTAVDVRHVNDQGAVDVTYVADGRAHRVRGQRAILACYNASVPYICPDVPRTQVEAIQVATKIPLTYINIALRNWKAFENVGFSSFYIPQPDLMHSLSLDFPVSIGNYEFARTSDEPIIVHGTYVPTVPDLGLTERQQHEAGRARLFSLSFADFEKSIVRTMSGALGSGDFDAERDIAGITVNRWPHGYAYEYNELYDPPEWNPKNGPHIQGAAQIGRISIANSDASAYAYVNGAIDAAYRAVNEQLDS